MVSENGARSTENAGGRMPTFRDFGATLVGVCKLFSSSRLCDVKVSNVAEYAFALPRSTRTSTGCERPDAFTNFKTISLLEPIFPAEQYSVLVSGAAAASRSFPSKKHRILSGEYSMRTSCQIPGSIKPGIC